VSVGIIDDQEINAANAGGDQFFVTTGLLHKANDDRLRRSSRMSSHTRT
jgi:hypothetical protein